MSSDLPRILYLHGLNSSPASAKAQQLQRLMEQLGLQDCLQVPALNHHPRVALEYLESLVADLGRPVLVGSSLGGYYATHLAERHRLKALLINPAVNPHRLFDSALGMQTNYHNGATWELTADHLAALAALEVPAPREGERYQVWLQTADETLDYRAAEHFYRHAALRIQSGGDHGFQGFAAQLPALLAFAGFAREQWGTFDFSILN